MTTFERRKALIETRYEELVTRANIPLEGNGIYTRYAHPVITADMVPPFWKYDYDPERNPYFMERIGVNATLNSGAIPFPRASHHDARHRRQPHHQHLRHAPYAA